MTMTSAADGSLIVGLRQTIDYYGQKGEQHFEFVLTAEDEADLLAELLVRRQGQQRRVAGPVQDAAHGRA